MAFQFKEGESVPRGIKRMVRKEIDKALGKQSVNRFILLLAGPARTPVAAGPTA